MLVVFCSRDYDYASAAAQSCSSCAATGGTVAAATPQRVATRVEALPPDPPQADCAFGESLPSVRALHGESATGLAFSDHSAF